MFINAPFTDGGNRAGEPIVDANVQAVFNAAIQLEELGFAPYPEIYYRHQMDRYREQPTHKAWNTAKSWIQISDIMLSLRKGTMTCRDADLRENFAKEFGVRVVYLMKDLMPKGM